MSVRPPGKVVAESVGGGYKGAMTDPYPLRPVREEEFNAWSRMISDTYGSDRTDEELTLQRAATQLDRTVAAFDGTTPVGGGSVYRRLLTVPGAVTPVAGIATVGVAPTHRRRGILTSMARKQLLDLHEQAGEPQSGEALAVLRPAEAAIYGRYGYGAATRGDQLRCDKSAMRFRPDTDFGDGTVHLLGSQEARPLLERVYDEARLGSVGWPDRAEPHWDVRLFDGPHRRGGGTSLRYAVHRNASKDTTGYALYRHRPGHGIPGVPGNDAGTLQVQELVALNHRAYASLWRYLAGIDLARWIEYEAAVDDALPHLLTDARAARSSTVDRLWVRLVDVDRALAARRYAVPLDLVIEVEDDFCAWNAGRYRLQADGEHVTCVRTTASAELRLTVAELGAAYFGGTTLASLAAAGLVEELRTGALARATQAFRADREPFYPGGWAFPLY